MAEVYIGHRNTFNNQNNMILKQNNIKDLDSIIYIISVLVSYSMIIIGLISIVFNLYEKVFFAFATALYICFITVNVINLIKLIQIPNPTHTGNYNNYLKLSIFIEGLCEVLKNILIIAAIQYVTKLI